jgi:basic amino acid/polyamine antiporter, APA family
VPYVNGQFIVPLLLIGAVLLVVIKAPSHFKDIFSKEGFPMILFWLVTAIIAFYSYLKKFSLIPVLGMTSCFYLMAQESHTNWYRFLIWLAIGLVIYFLYSQHNSKLSKQNIQ